MIQLGNLLFQYLDHPMPHIMIYFPIHLTYKSAYYICFTVAATVLIENCEWVLIRTKCSINPQQNTNYFLHSEFWWTVEKDCKIRLCSLFAIIPFRKPDVEFQLYTLQIILMTTKLLWPFLLENVYIGLNNFYVSII